MTDCSFRRLHPLLLIPLLIAGCVRHAPPATSSAARPSAADAPPAWIRGAFADDYGSRHTITADGWIQEGYARYHVVRWDAAGEHLIARNDSANAADAGKWTRIDWIRLDGMAPYEWAYCISIWNAATPDDAERAAVADRSTPRTGCGGHPFTRMKRAG